MRKLFFAIFVALSLAGCATTGDSVIIDKKPQTKVLAVPDNLVVDAVIPAPPNKAEYMEATPTDREALLRKYASSLIKVITIANTQFANIRKWSKEQTDIYTDKKTD